MENKEENEMENWEEPKKNRTGIIIGILLLIIIGLGVFIFLNKDKLFQVVESNSSTTEQQNTKENNNKTVDNNNENEEEIIKPLDLTKCLNCNGNLTFKDQSELSASNHFEITNNNSNLKLTIHWETFCKMSGASDCANEPIDYEIRGINKKVQSTMIGGRGQSINSVTFYYLLEDGTVEYTKLYKNNKDSAGNNYYAINYSYDNTQKDNMGNPTTYFASQGTVPNVNNIVKLYNVQVYEENGGGHATTIGALADGSFYDLGIE